MDEETKTRWRDAADFLAAVREAAMDAERTSRAVERMESQEGVRAQSYEPGVSRSSADPNGTARVISRMDYERVVEQRVEDDWALVDLACSVIYGREQDGRGGVASICGSGHADVLWWRFCAAETWRHVSEVVGYTERQCQRMCGEAVRTIDLLGMDATIAGQRTTKNRS